MKTGVLTKTEIMTSLQESLRKLEELLWTCDEATLDESLGKASGRLNKLLDICMIQKKSGQSG